MTKRPQSRSRAKLPNGARAEVKCCRACGRPIVPAAAFHLPPMQKRILALVERHGEIDPELLWTALYGSDPNGGPTSLKVVDVHINALNKNLRRYGIAVKRRLFRIRDEPWCLVSLPQQEAAE